MKKKGTVRERAIRTASDLFYRQGYNLTGVNQIIAEADIAKASLFQHFPTKEDLCVAYLASKNEKWLNDLREAMDMSSSKNEKIFQAFEFLKRNAPKEQFRGCSFLNILSEVPGDNDKILKEVRRNKAALQHILKESILPDKQHKSNAIYILFEGAIIESQVQKDIWPIEEAQQVAQEILN
ncbi:MAG: TetR/AcrR family transcriptional regulator [Cyclobacteriaceae bacterium]|nr:TetR/AcrR family transcriptional regulator [Cyclobacteriaceae bacterium HetDA_MAG_MS6]